MEATNEITRIKPLEQPEWTQILLKIYNKKLREIVVEGAVANERI